MLALFCRTTSFVNEQCKSRTIVRCEHVMNGVTKIFSVSKIATNNKPLLTQDLNPGVDAEPPPQKKNYYLRTVKYVCSVDVGHLVDI